MADIQHPWQSGPSELISFALEHLHKEGEANQRIAFLLLDVGIETLFKTFLLLSDKMTGTGITYAERKKAVDGNFSDLCNGLERAAGARLQGINLEHVGFFHQKRNQLYHEGNGITIPKNLVRDYAKLSVDLLNRLLDVDLDEELRKPEIEAQRAEEDKAQIAQEEEEVNQKVAEIKKERLALAEIAGRAIERIYPALILPSFKVYFETLKNEARTGKKGHRASAELTQARSALADVTARQHIEELYVYNDIVELYIDILQTLIETQASSNSNYDRRDWYFWYQSSVDYPKYARKEENFDEFDNPISWDRSHADVLASGDSAIKSLKRVQQRIIKWFNRGEISPPPIQSVKSRLKVVRKGSKQTSDIYVLYQKFFAELLEELKQTRPGVTQASKTKLASWFWFGAGRSGFYFGWSFRRGEVLSVDVWINMPDPEINKRAFDELIKDQKAIQNESELSFIWERLDDHKQSHVRVERKCKVTDSPEELEKTKTWALETTLKVVDLFQHRIWQLG